MFTGLVQKLGRVAAVKPTPEGIRLTLLREGWEPNGQPIREGDSICVSGVCLTVAEPPVEALHFDIITETLRRTTLGNLKPGDAVNLEPSLTPSTPIGGHFVQGHVDGVGRIVAIQNNPEDWRLTIEPPAELLDYITEKGSITLDGVSLTIAAVKGNRFEVALIPTTLRITTLGRIEEGTTINIEADILTKTIVTLLKRSGRL